MTGSVPIIFCTVITCILSGAGSWQKNAVPGPATLTGSFIHFCLNIGRYYVRKTGSLSSIFLSLINTCLLSGAGSGQKNAGSGPATLTGSLIHFAWILVAIVRGRRVVYRVNLSHPRFMQHWNIFHCPDVAIWLRGSGSGSTGLPVCNQYRGTYI